MFAVIKTGGKQYKVAQDDIIIVEKLEADAGEQFIFDEVMMVGEGDSVEMGAPSIVGAQVVGEIVEQRRGAKVIIFKKRQRNTYRRKKGHRQHETVIKITEILAKGGKSAAKKAAAKPEAKAEAPAAAEAAAGSDDLTKLTGVGKVAAGKMADAGYTSFAQIAALTDAQFAELDEAVFKGRVPQAQLVEEAKGLAG